MIEAGQFIAPAKARGFDFYTGVPCSFLTPLIDGVISEKSLTDAAAWLRQRLDNGRGV